MGIADHLQSYPREGFHSDRFLDGARDKRRFYLPIKSTAEQDQNYRTTFFNPLS